jgi:hypothetical protein
MQASLSRSVIGPAGQAGSGSKQIEYFGWPPERHSRAPVRRCSSSVQPSSRMDALSSRHEQIRAAGQHRLVGADTHRPSCLRAKLSGVRGGYRARRVLG